MTTYQAIATREGKWWMVTIPEIGGLTQAHSLREIEPMARSYIAVDQNIDPETITINVVVEQVGSVNELAKTVADIARRRSEAARLEQEALAATTTLAKQFNQEGITVRDIGEILGISYQRAHQLINA